MSYLETFGVDEHVPDFAENEKNWKAGFHVDAGEKRHELAEMSREHLERTIKYFKDSDTTPLKKELRKREEEVNKQK